MATFNLRVALLLNAIVLLAQAKSPACITVNGQDEVPVSIAAEQAIIVWDQARHQEHFIRRAQFRFTDPNFGFLVPTPSEPSLSKVDDKAFDTLEDLGKPEVREKINRQYRVGLGAWEWFLNSHPTMSAGIPDGVGSAQVIREARLGDYAVSIVKADDLASLGAWLSSNGYAFDQRLQNWLQPYVEAGWFITAFKISPEVEKLRPDLPAFRMTFNSSRPFYPYREPSDSSSDGERMLNLYVLSTARVEGRLQNKPWTAKTVWTRTLNDTTGTVVAEQLGLPVALLAKSNRLTRVQDASNPRPASADLFLVPSRDQAQLTAPPVIVEKNAEVIIPAELLVVLTVSAGIYARRVRARRQEDFD